MLKQLGYGVKSHLVGVVRRGPRMILWTPDWMGLGNWLYLWLWADIGRRAGADRVVLWQPGMERWLTAFPSLRDLTVERPDVSFFDRRHKELTQHGIFGTSFQAQELDLFVRDHLVKGLDVAEPASDPASIVVNVRRGDYYSNPQFEAQFGFDQVDYLRKATASAGSSNPRFVVVSDDHEWCRANLSWLSETGELQFSERTEGAMSDLRTLSNAHKLILTNSTFSYWGGYVSSVMSGGHSTVWAPSFFSRDQAGGKAWQLDPRWHVVNVRSSDLPATPDEGHPLPDSRAHG